MENPFNQMNRHKELIETFLEYNGIVKQVQNLLVMANDKMIIENESPNANIIKYDEIIKSGHDLPGFFEFITLLAFIYFADLILTSLFPHDIIKYVHFNK